MHAWLQRWAQRYPRLTDWVEAQIGETLNSYRLPRQHAPSTRGLARRLGRSQRPGIMTVGNHPNRSIPNGDRHLFLHSECH